MVLTTELQGAYRLDRKRQWLLIEIPVKGRKLIPPQNHPSPEGINKATAIGNELCIAAYHSQQSNADTSRPDGSTHKQEKYMEQNGDRKVYAYQER